MKHIFKKIAYVLGIAFVALLGLGMVLEHQTPAERAASEQRAAARAEQMKQETAAKIAQNRLAWQRDMVQTMAHDYVLGNLKAPKTATFADHPEVRNLGNGTYEVSSYVDSQNAFGAMIRTHYAITLKTDDSLHFRFLKTHMY